MNFADIPPQRSVATVVWMTVLFGPLGMLTLGAKVGLLAILICVVAALFTMGLSILVQIVALPFIAYSIVAKSNARRAAMLAAVGQR